MRLSKLFTKTSKTSPKDEVSFNAQILIRAGFVDKVTAGVYTFLPLGLRVHNKICRVIREEMDALGAQEILMPALTPRELWQTTGRWDNFDALFKLGASDKDFDYALGATHEEIVTPTVKKQVFSYKDLPTAVYQIQTKFRNEPRAKAGLLRGREFSMKDLYSFHANEADLDAYYKLAQKAYFKIFERFGLLDITYLTFASGGAFSKFSHEYQTVSESGEDTIYICDKCQVAVNREISAEQKACPNCGNAGLREAKAIETGNIFKLGDRFTKAFDFKYTDETGAERPVIMGCYGMGPSRIMGTVVEAHHDDKGIIWPEEIAPFKIHLISLNQDEAAGRLYDKLTAAGWDALFDDRELSAGEKFADADLFGCPWRLVLSNKTAKDGVVEVKRRHEDKAVMIKPDKLVDYLKA